MNPGNIISNNVVWIFDLDGTLWEENSHVSIVEKHLGRKKYTNLLSRIWCRFFFDSFMESLNRDYRDVPQENIKNFNPHIVTETSEMVRNALKRGEKVIIISSAPVEIVEKAQEMFGVPAYHAEIGKKAEIYKCIGVNSNKVNVVTDNVSDKDLIEISDTTYFRLNKQNSKRRLTEYQDKILYL